MGCGPQGRGCSMNLVKLIKRRQPKGPWWCCVVDGDKIGGVSRHRKLDKDFRRWVADCHLAGLDVDLITEESARRLIDRGWYQPTIAKFKAVQPKGPWIIQSYDGDGRPMHGCIIHAFTEDFRDWAFERSAEGLRLELVR